MENTRNLYLSQKLGADRKQDEKPSLSKIDGLVRVIRLEENFKDLKDADIFIKISEFDLKTYKYFYAMLFQKNYAECKKLLQ